MTREFFTITALVLGGWLSATIGFCAVTPCTSLFADGSALSSRSEQNPVRNSPHPFQLLSRAQHSEDTGPRLFLPAFNQMARKKPTFWIGSFNIENLTDRNLVSVQTIDWKAEETRRSREPYTGSDVSKLPETDKSVRKLFAAAAMMRRAQFDFTFVQEVGSIAALEAFNQKYLKLPNETLSPYRTILIPGNDPHNRHIGMIVRKDFPFDIEVQSYRNLARAGSTHVPLFYRDTPVVLFWRPGADRKRDLPSSIVIGVHLKALLATDIRSEVEHLQRAQIEGTLDIVQFYDDHFHAQVPIAVAGDFNGDLRSQPEFRSFFDFGFKDSFDLVTDHSRTVPAAKRATHHRIDSRSVPGNIVSSQADGVLVLLPHGSAFKVLDSSIIPVSRDDGISSDHQMVAAQFRVPD